LFGYPERKSENAIHFLRSVIGIALSLALVLVSLSCKNPHKNPQNRNPGPRRISSETLEQARKTFIDAQQADDLNGYTKAEELFLQAEKKYESEVTLLCEIGGFYSDYHRFLVIQNDLRGEKRLLDLAMEKSLAWKSAYEKAIRLDPRHTDGFTGLARYYLYGPGQDPRKAIELLNQAAKTMPSNEFRYHDIAMAYLALKDFDHALKYVEMDINHAAETHDEMTFRMSQEWLGHIYVSKGDNEKAEAMFKEAGKDLEAFNEKNHYYWGCPFKALGELYAHSNKKEKAAGYYLRAADIESTNFDTQFSAARSSFDVGDLRDAWIYIHRAMALTQSSKFTELCDRIHKEMTSRGIAVGDIPINPPDDFLEAMIAFEENRLEPSLAHVDRVLTTGNNEPAKVLKGYILLYQKKYEEAEDLFRQVAVVNPNEAGVLAGRGHLALVRKDFGNASLLFASAIDATEIEHSETTGNRDPRVIYARVVSETASLGMAWSMTYENRHEEAVASYDRILSSNPEHMLAMIGKGDSLMGLHRVEEAETLFRKVLEKHPDNPNALADLALAEYNQGKDAEAEKNFLAALQYDGERYTCPYEGLGLLYLRQGKTEKAKDLFEKAIKINPEIDYKKFNELAKIYLSEGKFDEAERLLKKSIENYPYDKEATDLLNQVRRN